jgi:hypothetical protein
VLHLPALLVVNGTLRAEVAFTSAVPRARRDGHVTALGVDWGLNTLLSAGAAPLHPDGTITALGAGAQYRAAGVLAKTHRLRRHGERLHAKADQYEKLGAARPGHPLAAKAAVLAEERRRVSERRSHLNGALAWSAARWAVDQAIAAGASVIYLEDLRTLEARGMGRTLNVRLSQTVRGQIADRIRHLASEHGIAVVTVPARGTSKYCPRCLAQLRHHGSDSSIRRSCCPAVTISGVRFRKQVIRLPLALPSPVAVCTFTSAGVLLAWAKPSAIAMTDASCRASTKRKSSGKSLRNVSSVDPGLPNTVVSPRPRSSPNVASRTLSTRSSMSPPGA